MLKIFDKFFGNKLENEDESNNEINNNDLKETLENIFSKIDGILLIEKKHWSERNICKCSDADFEELSSEIAKNGLSIEFSAGEYVISKSIKNNKGSVTTILKSFIHKTK